MSDTQKCKSNELRVGDKLSTTVYYTVTEVQNGRVKVIDETGSTLTISNAIIERESFTAEQFDEEVKVSRTELVKALQNAGDTIFKAVFKKKNGERRRTHRPSGSRVRRHMLWPHRGARVPSGTKPQKRQIDHRTLEEVTIRNKKMKLK